MIPSDSQQKADHYLGTIFKSDSIDQLDEFFFQQLQSILFEVLGVELFANITDQGAQTGFTFIGSNIALHEDSDEEDSNSLVSDRAIMAKHLVEEVFEEGETPTLSMGCLMIHAGRARFDSLEKDEQTIEIAEIGFREPVGVHASFGESIQMMMSSWCDPRAEDNLPSENTQDFAVKSLYGFCRACLLQSRSIFVREIEAALAMSVLEIQQTIQLLENLSDKLNFGRQ